jgi:hypothetical protein
MKKIVILILAGLACSIAQAADLSGVPRIVDGATLTIGATKVRLQGIDAPETDQICLRVYAASGAAILARASRLIFLGTFWGMSLVSPTRTFAARQTISGATTGTTPANAEMSEYPPFRRFP